jgi:hypothetical protein
MIRPRASLFISGSIADVTRKALSRLMPITRRHSSWVMCSKLCEGIDACVVDQHIDVAKPVLDEGTHTCAIGAGRHIGLEGRQARICAVGDQAIKPLMVDIDGDDGSAFAQKPVGDRASQTTGCAGHDSDEVVQPHVFASSGI